MTGIPPLAQRLADYVAAHPSHKIRLDDLRGHATRIDPTLLGDPTARARLADVLNALADAGLLVLPKNRRNWDDRSAPRLPAWVTKPARPRTPAPAAPAPRVWPTALEAAAAIATRPDELTLLDRIATWLRHNPDPEPIPIEERSLEILDEEKALAVELGKRLFTTGTLTLDLLACYITPLPFPSQHVPGTGPTRLLVSENNAAYHSLLTAARAQSEQTRPDLHIAWGSGNQFPVSIASVALLDPTPAAIYYVGDLDLAGLRIATSAAAAARTLGLPPLQPAANLYRWLRDHGSPRPDRSNTGTLTDLDTLLAWLPDDLHTLGHDLLMTRRRIPQETLGLRALRQEPHLIAAAVHPTPTVGAGQ